MLKFLLLIAIAMIIALPINGQEKSPKSPRDQERSKQIEKPVGNTAPAIQISLLNQQSPTIESEGSKKHPKSYLRRLFAAENLPNLFLVLVGALGVCAAVKTLMAIKRQAAIMVLQTREMRSQTAVAKTAAETAKTSADHMITSERAWLVIRSSMEGFNLTRDDHPSFWWIIKNTGKTPARLIETQCVYELVEGTDVSSLPLIAHYPDPIALNEVPLPPGDSVGYSTFLRQAGKPLVVHGIKEDQIRYISGNAGSGVPCGLRAYGYVAYYDVFGKRRESRFCEYYVCPRNGVDKRATGFRPLLGIPSEYTQHT